MAPIKGTPAFEAGLQAGDEIIKINGEDMAGVGADEIASMIKTGEESHFVMEVRRDGEMLTFEMDRQHIDIPSVDGSFLEGQQGMADRLCSRGCHMPCSKRVIYQQQCI